MRTMTPDLLAAQATPDAQATVTIRSKRRATFAGDPLAWRPLFRHTAANLPYADVDITSAACPCLESGCFVRALRSPLTRKVGAQRLNALTWEGDGSAWSGAAATALSAAPVDLADLTIADTGVSTPGIARFNATMRIFYGDGGRLRYLASANDGVSWGAFANIWDARALYTRFTNFAAVTLAAYTPTPWLIVANGITSTGSTRVAGIHSIGSGWVVWPEMPVDAAATQWQIAGIQPGPPADPNSAYLYLWANKGGYNVLACQRVALTSAGVFSAWDGEAQIVDRAGPSDGAAFDAVRFAPAAGAYLFALQEKAVNRYWFVSALFGLPGSLDMEEPVYLDNAVLQATSSESLTPLQAGRRALLIGSSSVWTSATADEPANLSVRIHTPISYTYTVEANGGGVLQASVDRASSGQDAPETFAPVADPEIYVGDILWLDRTLDGETMTLAFRVAQVAYSRRQVDIFAVDALGVLAHMRPRRPKVLAAGERLRMADVDAICHWVGLDVTGSGTLPGAVDPAPGFTWSANESGLGALRRYLMDQATALRSAGATTSTAHTVVELTVLPTVSTYTYVSPAGLVESSPAHEIAEWGLVLDSRQPRLFVANGLATAGDPGDPEGSLGDEGEKAWAITAARPLPGSRPYPLAAVDYSYATSDGRLQALSAAQAQWQLFGLPLGWIEGTANLGVELYDVITVDQTKARVVGITETWEQGRLRQRLELAEVDAFGVGVG